MVQALIYGVLVYSMIGFEWTVAKFLWYLFFMYFTLLYFTFYGMMAVGLTPNESIAAIISSAFYNIWNLFSGYLIPRPVSYPLDTFCISVSLVLNGASCVRVTYPLNIFTPETSCLVEVVLMDLPGGMDAIRAGCLPIWRSPSST
jgi:hypothetical protein